VSLLAPGLKLLVVAILIASGADVVFLATGYVAIGTAGVLLYGSMLFRLLRRAGVLKMSHFRGFECPAGDIFSYACPMMLSTIVWLLMELSGPLLLGYFKDAEAVASFRAVQPIAHLNMLISTAFTTFFVPSAAKLYARKDHLQLSSLYWQTATWMMVLSIPIFIATFSFGELVTTTILGGKYADAGSIMVILSLGYFVQTVLGFNGATLKVFRKLRFIVVINILVSVINVLLNLALIPQFGELGAAIALTSTMILHNILKQYGLVKYTGIALFDRRYALTYATGLLLALSLGALQLLYPVSIWIALPTIASATILMLWTARRVLEVGATFPELRRWPILRSVLGA
jgi:O-antigen/teichoic acid export membrane protein